MSQRQPYTHRYCVENTPILSDMDIPTTESTYNTTVCSQSPICTVAASGQSNVNVSTLCEKLHSIRMENKFYEGADAIKEITPNIDVAGLPYDDDIPELKQDTDGDTLLHTVIILQETDIALQFINKATSLDQLSIQNHLCQTPLHLAVLTNQISVARRLVVGGADIESRDRDGNTALHIACREGFQDIVTVILEPLRYIETKQNRYDLSFQKRPQNLELSNYEGLNCLNIAALNMHFDVVKFLIEKGANVNSKDLKTGRTILHGACVNGNINLVKLLLQCPQCELNAKTYDGYYPFDLARARGNYDVIKILAVAGAQYGDSEEEMES